MTDIQLYTKIANLSDRLKSEVSDYIDFLKYKSNKKTNTPAKRTAGKAKGLITMKDNFDDPIQGFEAYM